MNPRRRRPALVIFVLASAVMILEVALTRVFSFITYHHMTYLVIGVAMLGFGAAGTFLTVRRPSKDELWKVVSRHSGMLAVATLALLFLAPKMRFGQMDMYDIGSYGNLLVLLPLTALTAVPFFFGGVGIATLVSNAGEAVGRVYFADLAGSAAGSLVSILLVNTLGAVATCVVAAGMALLAGALASEKPLSRVVLSACLILLSPLAERREILTLHVPPGKQLYGSEDKIEATEWHAITRLDVGAEMTCNCSFGGSLSLAYKGPPPAVHLIFQDGSNLTGVIHPTPTPEATPVLGYYLQGAPFVLRPRAQGLVIGSGGGVDVMVGLHQGAEHLVAVDVNPKTMALVRGRYAEFAGHVFDGPSVEPVVSEGRHFLNRDKRKFDVIQLSGVDTWAAQAAGAYALTENFIYTAEAFDQYLAHLRPEGILGFSRPYVDPPLEASRLVATAVDALERRGAAEPYRHLLVLAGQGQMSATPWAELLVKEAPFTEAESAAMSDFARRLDFQVVYDPFGPGDGPLDPFARMPGPDRRDLLAHYELDVRPVTDDAPFYFQNHRWRDLFRAPPLGVSPPMAMWMLAGSFVQILVLSALFILYPLYRLPSAAGGRRARAGVFFYFASLGMGFILVEIALLQKLTVFLGGPAYALSITLSTLLSASGLGSFVSGRTGARPARVMTLVTPLLAASIVGLALVLEVLLRPFAGLSLPVRALAAALFVGPPGFLMGMLFPTALRETERKSPELVPWAWGINACATVVGTTACMLIVSSFGFRAALLTGAAIYVAGWLVLAAARPRAPEAPIEPGPPG